MTIRLFVTGTDTDIGKTVVTRALIGAFSRRGLKVNVAKPVESGAKMLDGQLVPQDALALARASGCTTGLEKVCAYCFPDPVSPHLAAARVNKTIEAEPILSLLQKQAEGVDVVLAEGAGGLLVPLSDTLLMADIVARAGFSLIIVAPNVLGTINTTLLTIEAARHRNINTKGVILNRTPEADLGNASAIAKNGKLPIIGEFPTATPIDDNTLAELAEDRLDLDRLLSDER